MALGVEKGPVRRMSKLIEVCALHTRLKNVAQRACRACQVLRPTLQRCVTPTGFDPSPLFNSAGQPRSDTREVLQM